MRHDLGLERAGRGGAAVLGAHRRRGRLRQLGREAAHRDAHDAEPGEHRKERRADAYLAFIGLGEEEVAALVGLVDQHETRDPVRYLGRGGAHDRSAPAVTDEHERTVPEVREEVEQIVDEPGQDARRRIARAAPEAAAVVDDCRRVSRDGGGDCAPLVARRAHAGLEHHDRRSGAGALEVERPAVARAGPIAGPGGFGSGSSTLLVHKVRLTLLSGCVPLDDRNAERAPVSRARGTRRTRCPRGRPSPSSAPVAR